MLVFIQPLNDPRAARAAANAVSRPATLALLSARSAFWLVRRLVEAGLWRKD